MTKRPSLHSSYKCKNTNIKYDLSHLNVFQVVVKNKRVKEGDNLTIDFLFSNHVYSKRTNHHQDDHDFLDYLGKKRSFDLDRYNISKNLNAIIKGYFEYKYLNQNIQSKIIFLT